MSAMRELQIEQQPGNRVTLPPLELERDMAKVTYSISAAPAMKGMEIVSLQVCNIPGAEQFSAIRLLRRRKTNMFPATGVS